MIGYFLEQELRQLPARRRSRSRRILTMVEVDPDDPAFDDPTKFVGPVYTKDAGGQAGRRRRGGRSSRTASSWRRVVPSPEPQRIFEIRPIRGLLDHGVVVICAGGGGVPTMFDPAPSTTLVGVEAVIDKDLASELLAREVDADLLVMATDVDGVYAGLGHARAATPRAASRPTELRATRLPRRVDGSEGRGGRAGSWRRPGSAPRSARSTHIEADRRRHGRNPGGAALSAASREGRRTWPRSGSTPRSDDCAR